MAKYKDFKEYMQANYSEVIINKLKPVIYEDKDSFESEYFLTITIAKPTNITVDGVTFNDLGDEWLEIRTTVYAEIEITGKTRNDYESDLVSKPYNVFFKAKLQDGLKDASVTKVEEYSKPKFDKDKSLSQNLLHYFYEEDIEKHAEDFLLNHFPRALNEPMPLPVEVIAKNMGMEIYYAPLGESIFGKTYFGTETVTVYTDMFGTDTKEISTRPGTMLINLDVYFMYNIGTVNNTIIHECVHWDKHRRAFELQKLLDTGNKSITCEVVETTYKGIPNDAPALKWMEWQANQLAPRILMPAKTTKLLLVELISNERSDNPDERNSAIMESAIKKLAEFFGVSLMAAKLRAIELGFEQAQGVFVYCNNDRLPAFSFAKGAINKNQTYVIDKNNLLFNLIAQPELTQLFCDGTVIYVNYMLCLNTQKYIEYDNHNNPKLTDYALDHIDECCLVFDREYSTSTEYEDTFYRRCFLCRDIDASQFVEANYNPDHKTNQDIRERKAELKKICAFTDDMVKVFGELPGNFSNTLKYHMKRLDVTVDELADRSYISTVTISHYRSDNACSKSLESVLAIGKALCLHPTYFEDLLEKAGYSDRHDKTWVIVKYLINNQQDETIEEWQKTLDEAGVNLKLPTKKD